MQLERRLLSKVDLVIVRMIVQTALLLCALAGVLFPAAGDWQWPQGWMFLGEFAALAFTVGFWLARHDPALLASRLSLPMQRGQPPADRVFMSGFSALFVGWLVLAALDARRYGWSHVPHGAQALGALLIALGMSIVWQVFRYNSFAVPQVRLQAERGQRVVTDGPYRIVRHPMYAGGIFYLLGTALLLGSWWGLLSGSLLIAGLALRAVGEERTLRRALAGYGDYERRVRFRLIPGVW